VPARHPLLSGRGTGVGPVSDGLPGVWLVRGAQIALVAALLLGLYLLVATPTLSHERRRTAAAPPPTVVAPAGARTGSPPAAPAPGAAPAPPAPPPAAARTPTVVARTPTATAPAAQRYTIQSGDTLLAIAERYDTTVDAIRAANPGLNENALQVGAEITIPTGR
jgi:LysM repeat protein